MAEHRAFRNVFGDLMVQETTDRGIAYFKIHEASVSSISIAHARNSLVWTVEVQHVDHRAVFGCDSSKAAERLFRELCDLTKIDLEAAVPASDQDEPDPTIRIVKSDGSEWESAPGEEPVQVAPPIPVEKFYRLYNEEPGKPAPEGLLGTWLPNPGIEVFGPFADVDLSGIIGKTVTEQGVTVEVEVGPIPPPDDECVRLVAPPAGVKVLTTAGWLLVIPEEKPQVTTVVNNGITPEQLADALNSWKEYQASRPAKTESLEPSFRIRTQDGKKYLVTSKGNVRMVDVASEFGTGGCPLRKETHLHTWAGGTGCIVYLADGSLGFSAPSLEAAKVYIEENY